MFPGIELQLRFGYFTDFVKSRDYVTMMLGSFDLWKDCCQRYKSAQIVDLKDGQFFDFKPGKSQVDMAIITARKITDSIKYVFIMQHNLVEQRFLVEAWNFGTDEIYKRDSMFVSGEILSHGVEADATHVTNNIMAGGITRFRRDIIYNPFQKVWIPFDQLIPGGQYWQMKISRAYISLRK